MGKQIKTTCLKCKSEVTLDFGDANYSEALKLADQIDKRPMECPGFHVEVGGWKKYWQIVNAIDSAYSEEDKDACRDIVRRIIVKLPDSSTPEKEHEFKTEQETHQFVTGLIDGGMSDLTSLIVTHFNALKEYIGEYKGSAKKILTYLDDSYLY